MIDAYIILIVLFLILLVYLRQRGWLVGGKKLNPEPFEQDSNFMVKRGNDIYDQFYSNIYDYLTLDRIRNKFEIDTITKYAPLTEDSSVLDIGCGIGNTLGDIKNTKKTDNISGLDLSSDMIKKAKSKYPDITFKCGNALNDYSYRPLSFTHILCLYFTIYEIQNKERFFQNTNSWLRPGGFLVVHMVEREKFDFVLPPSNLSPSILWGGGSNNKQLQGQTKIEFAEFTYVSNFTTPNVDKDERCKYMEKFMMTDQPNKTRVHDRILYIPPIKSIVSMATRHNFKIHQIVEMDTCSYDYQYLYFFIKQGRN